MELKQRISLTLKKASSMTSECGKCHEEFEVKDNEFFCDKCKPIKKETLEDLDFNSDECLSCQ